MDEYWISLQCFNSVGWQEGHPACKKLEWWGVGVVAYGPADATATHCLFLQ